MWKINIWTGCKNARVSSPDLWNAMYLKKYISIQLKKELIEQENLRGKNLNWFMCYPVEEEVCFLFCITEGVCYRNVGIGWDCLGSGFSERPEDYPQLIHVY